MAHSSGNLDEQLHDLMSSASDERVARAFAAFNAAAALVPGPVVANTAPVHYSTSGNR